MNFVKMKKVINENVLWSVICSFPAATNETFLQKINSVHKDNEYYEVPHKKELAFIIRHYAGKVKYQVRLKFLNEYSIFKALVHGHSVYYYTLQFNHMGLKEVKTNILMMYVLCQWEIIGKHELRAVKSS